MKENLLVVDDTPDNLRLLAAILSGQGYHIRKALNGAIALQSIEQMPPDLILLDINMPQMNGYEVCRILKANPKTQDIPIIFISALDETWDKVQAFNAGGSDYISKPFKEQEVIARIENQLTIQRQKQQLKAEVEERQKAEKTLQTYLQIVSHDLRNPVLGMSMVLKNFLKNCLTDEEIKIPRSVVERMSQSCDRQLTLINSLVENQQFESQNIKLNLQTLDLPQLLNNFKAEWQPQLQENQAQLQLEIPPHLPFISADSNLLWRVFENLMANALKYNEKQKDKNLLITICITIQNDFLYCQFEDDGVGIPPALQQSIFKPYQRGLSSPQTFGLGLGLYLCRQIIQAHGGDIGITHSPSPGAKIWFTLPLKNPSDYPS